MKEERIAYEEFMIMFKNAPRIAYTLYDKAEDEIDRLNNIIDELKEDMPCLLEIINRNEKEIKVYQDEWIAIRSVEEKLKELKEGK